MKRKFSEPVKVIMKLYSLLEREDSTLVDGKKDAGSHSRKDNSGKEVFSGVYLYCPGAGSFTATKKMILLK